MKNPIIIVLLTLGIVVSSWAAGNQHGKSYSSRRAARELEKVRHDLWATNAVLTAGERSLRQSVAKLAHESAENERRAILAESKIRGMQIKIDSLTAQLDAANARALPRR